MIRYLIKPWVVGVMILLISVPAAAQQQITGRILDRKEVTVTGEDVPNQVILVETESGRRFVADLGQASRWQGHRLEKGTRVRLQGDFGRVSDRPVLFATQVVIGDQAVTIKQDVQAGGDKAAEGLKADQRIVGLVVRDKRVTVRGTDLVHQAVLLETRGGEQVVADLGPVGSFREAPVERGDQLVVQGDFARIGSYLILIAETVRTGGRTIRIQR